MAESIFTVQTPANPDEDDGVELTLGTRFIPAVNGTITAIRWFFPASPVAGTINGRLYTWVSNTVGVLLGSANFVAPTPGTWNTAAVSIPVTAGTPYVTAIYTPLGEYVSTGALFASAITNGNLTATADTPLAENGKFIAANAYPDDSFNGNGYFVDVVFEASAVGIAVTGAGEIDAAFSINEAKSVTLGVASEINSALTIVPFAPISITLGVAEENNSATAIAEPGVESVGLGTSPCEPWTPIWCGVLPTGAAEISGTAVQVATEILWQMSGQRYGLCTVKLRPCRKQCSEGWGGWDDWWPGVGGMSRSFGGGGPRPWWYNGMWYNICNNGCGGSCSCTMIDEAILPSPTREVLNVMLNGEVMDPSRYRVDENRLLVRTDGELWPLCQDMAAADTEPNTWSVTITVGEDIPAMAQRAVGELAMEYIKDCLGEDCALPHDLTSLSRQGVNMSFAAPDGVFSVIGQVGLRWVNLFLQTANPNRLQQRARVYDVDRQPYRRVDTS